MALTALRRRPTSEEPEPAAAASAPARIPTLAEASPAYAALVAKRDDLHRRRVAVEREIGEIIERLAASGKLESQLRAEARVAVLLDDAVETRQPGRERLAELRQTTKDVDAALVEITIRIGRERHAASRVIAEQVAPRYREIVRSICVRLLRAHEAHLEYAALVNQLDAQDVGWIGLLEPLPPALLGNPRESSGRLGCYLRECAKAGMIRTAEIPEMLR